MYMFFVILKIAKIKINIERRDNSKPPKGKMDKIHALNPRTEIKPTPHAAHPGTNAARKTPKIPNKPILLSELKFILTL